MKYIIYSKEGCIRCERAKNKLLADGNKVEIHDAEIHGNGQLSGWQDRIEEFVGFKAQLCFQNEHLPVIYDCFNENYVQADEMEQLCKR